MIDNPTSKNLNNISPINQVASINCEDTVKSVENHITEKFFLSGQLLNNLNLDEDKKVTMNNARYDYEQLDVQDNSNELLAKNKTS